MIRTVSYFSIGIFFAMTVFSSTTFAVDFGVGLEDGFQNPPLIAKPRAYWVWLNGNFDLDQLTRDLEEMKDKGVGGLEVFDIGARDPKGVVPDGPAFMGPESANAVAHAVREAQRLGLEIGLITSSSWNAGGPWITPQHSAKGIFQSKIRVQGPRRVSERLSLTQNSSEGSKRSRWIASVFQRDSCAGDSFKRRERNQRFQFHHRSDGTL